MQPTLGLIQDLFRQVRELLVVEIALARAELRERGAAIPSNLAAVGIGVVFLPLGVLLVLVAISMLLTRLGVPLDLSFLIVGAVVIVAGLVALRLGANGLKPSRLTPTKSLSQISSLLREL